MAEYTQNINLEKPLGNENFRRKIFNDNMEKIDKKFGTAGDGHFHDGTPGQGRRINYNSLDGKPTAMEPTAHKASHAAGGNDMLTPADIGAETPAGAQAKVDAVGMELDAHKADNMLKLDCISGTTQHPTYTGEDITEIVHKDSNNVALRTDVITYTDTLITEVRTLSTGETLTLKYYFDADGTYDRTEVI